MPLMIPANGARAAVPRSFPLFGSTTAREAAMTARSAAPSGWNVNQASRGGVPVRVDCIGVIPGQSLCSEPRRARRQVYGVSPTIRWKERVKCD